MAAAFLIYSVYEFNQASWGRTANNSTSCSQVNFFADVVNDPNVGGFVAIGSVMCVLVTVSAGMVLCILSSILRHNEVWPYD